MREVLLFIHIVAAGAWVGANATQLLVTPAMRAVGGNSAANWMRQTVRLGTVLYAPAAVVALITGFWLVIDSSFYDFEQLFVAIGIAMVIVGGVLGARVYGPRGREAADLHEQGDEAGAAVVHHKIRRWALIDSALLLFTIYAMVDKLGTGA